MRLEADELKGDGMTEMLAIWAAVGISAASLIYTIVSNRSKATAHKVAAIEARVEGKADRAETMKLFERTDDLDHRTTKLESDLQHLPGKETTHRLEISLLEVKAELGVIAERIKPIAAISDRLQEAMIELAERASGNTSV